MRGQAARDRGNFIAGAALIAEACGWTRPRPRAFHYDSGTVLEAGDTAEAERLLRAARTAQGAAPAGRTRPSCSAISSKDDSKGVGRPSTSRAGRHALPPPAGPMAASAGRVPHPRGEDEAGSPTSRRRYDIVAARPRARSTSREALVGLRIRRMCCCRGQLQGAGRDDVEQDSRIAARGVLRPAVVGVREASHQLRRWPRRRTPEQVRRQQQVRYLLTKAGDAPSPTPAPSPSHDRLRRGPCGAAPTCTTPPATSRRRFRPWTVHRRAPR